MKRLAMVMAGAALAVVPFVETAPTAWAAAPAYVWDIDGAPFGPNVSTAADGSRVEISGDGILTNGEAFGGGWLTLYDAASGVTTVAAWAAFESASLIDEGDALPPTGLLRNGVAVLHIDVQGLGEGTLEIQCHDNPIGVEGVRLTLAGTSYNTIVVGSTGLATAGA